MGEARTKTMRGNEIKKPNTEMFSQEEDPGEIKHSYQTPDANHIHRTGSGRPASCASNPAEAKTELRRTATS